MARLFLKPTLDEQRKIKEKEAESKITAKNVDIQ
jgi:hypothetical protein